MFILTGIGSRKTPKGVLSLMFKIGQWCAQHDNVILRSGNAEGADKAFQDGFFSACNIPSIDYSRLEVYLPWNSFNYKYLPPQYKSKYAHVGVSLEAIEEAKQYHKYWHKIKDEQGPRKLHGRNSYQVLGKDLLTPANLVVCWTPDGCESHKTRSFKTGGTGTAISIADNEGIKIINLKNNNYTEKELFELLNILINNNNNSKNRKNKHKTYEGLIKDLKPNQVFVFGANSASFNGNPKKGTGGAALVATLKGWIDQYEYMANTISKSGKAYGIQTVSIFNKTLRRFKPLKDDEIIENIEKFYDYARDNPSKEFLVAYTKTKKKLLNGHSIEQMAKMFKLAAANNNIPINVIFEREFYKLIEESQIIIKDKKRNKKEVVFKSIFDKSKSYL